MSPTNRRCRSTCDRSGASPSFGCDRVPFSCLATVTDVINGEERTYPRLRYTDRIKDGKGGHLVDIPVFERAATVMRRQQDWLRRNHPHWFDETGEPLNADLRLWPKSTNNRDGTVPLSGSVVNSWIRRWVGKGARYHAAIQRIPKIVGPDGQPFPLGHVSEVGEVRPAMAMGGWLAGATCHWRRSLKSSKQG